MRNFFLLGIIIIFSFQAKGQFYNSGQDRGSIKWKQIKTDNFRIVYPEYADSIAQHYANTLKWAYENVTTDMHHQPHKIDVLIHTEASNSNGMVVWAPKRMEIFSTFPEDIYPQDWFEQLALHEYRHVIQIDKLDQGLTKILSYVFGQQIVGAVLGLYVPLWFLEGDAVWAETEYSLTGRGRLNYFSDELKTQFLEDRIYSFDKATMGSYKDFVPNHYVLGYNFVNQVRRDFGDSVWSNVLDYTGRHPYMVVPFSHALKLQTGMPKKKLYEFEMGKLDSLWRLKYLSYSDSVQSFIYNPELKSYTNYRYPSYINDSTLFSLKSSMDDISRFVSIDLKSGKEEILFTPGSSEFYSCSFCDSTICWSELRYNPRWHHHRYHVLMTYSLRTGKVRQLTHKTNLFAPEFSGDASKVVCVESTNDNRFYINIIDKETGEIIKRFPSAFFPTTPVFSVDESEVYFIRLHPQLGHSIAVLNLESGDIEDLTQPDYFIKASLVSADNEIFFESEYNGVLNVYSLDLDDKNIHQITDAPFSIADLNKNENGDLYYSYITSMGLRIASYSTGDFIRKPLYLKKKYENQMFKSGLPAQNKTIQSKPLIEKKFETRKYSKVGHLINIHSWAPVNIDINTYQYEPGVVFMSQNLLGTAELTGGYKYLTSNSGNYYYFDFAYKGWYPTLNFGAEHLNYLYQSTQGKDTSFRINSDFFYVSVAQPLNLSKGKYYNFIQPSASFGFQAVDAMPGKYYKSLRYRLYAHHLLRRGLRDLEPRWGQKLDVHYYHTPGSDYDFGSLFAMEASLYFPGIGRHHSLKIYAAAQENISADYQYNNVIEFPRGYTNLQSREALSIKTDYKMPIWYPDFSISSLAYIKRLKGGIFYDMTIIDWNSNEKILNSMGIDILVDMHFLRFVAPVEIGLRTTYVSEYSGFEYKLLFSIDFNGI